MKKIFLLISIFSIVSFAKTKPIDTYFDGAIIKIVESEKERNPKIDINKYIVENKNNILDEATYYVYEEVENTYNKISGKISKTNKNDRQVFIQSITETLKELGYNVENVELLIEYPQKIATVKITLKDKVSNYNKQIIDLLVTNTIRAITTEEYNVNLNIK